jgi:hypothetical protein
MDNIGRHERWEIGLFVTISFEKQQLNRTAMAVPKCHHSVDFEPCDY